MIGNDIVDLQFAKMTSRWQEQRFLDKMFTTAEQEFINSQTNSFNALWRLWSMKESAYKIIIRDTALIKFNPLAYNCLVHDAQLGWVHYEKCKIDTRTFNSQDYIYTTACHNTKYISEVIKLNNTDLRMQQSAVRDKLKSIFASIEKCAVEIIEIKKDTLGIPQLFKDGILQKHSVSMTHHGFFGACAMALD